MSFIEAMEESMNEGFYNIHWDLAMTCWYDHGNGD